VNVLIWHVHGSWTTAFVQGAHTYLIPVVGDRGPDGRGRARTWEWPENAVERTPAQLTETPIDVVVLQSRRDEELFLEWTGRRAGHDVPAIWLEHNAPQGRIADMRHPAADRDDLLVVHVTDTNALFWDCGTTRTVVIEHGIIDPGERYTGELERAAVVVNEPVRRGRVVGTDLLRRLSATVPLDVFGMGVEALRGGGIDAYEDVPQSQLHADLARRRVYLHPVRWTSLGLSLLEAMHLGMPVVALATTEVPAAVPPEAGVVSNDIDAVAAALRRFCNDREDAAACGKAARAAAVQRYGLGRFLDEWDDVIEEVAA
jgi:glycosyltransferase involved in cell wall biosynthesis